VVERLFAWLGRNRRLVKDLEATLASATAVPLRRLGDHFSFRPTITSTITRAL
jgi:hypothetical protein